MLYRLRKYLKKQVLIRIYNTTILAQIEYGSKVWGFAYPNHINILNALHNKAAKIINMAPYEESPVISMKKMDGLLFKIDSN